MAYIPDLENDMGEDIESMNDDLPTPPGNHPGANSLGSVGGRGGEQSPPPTTQSLQGEVELVNDALSDIQARWGALSANAEALGRFASDMYQYAEALKRDSLEVAKLRLDALKRLDAFLAQEKARVDALAKERAERKEEAVIKGEVEATAPQQQIKPLSIVERIKLNRQLAEKEKAEKEARKAIDKALSKGKA